MTRTGDPASVERCLPRSWIRGRAAGSARSSTPSLRDQCEPVIIAGAARAGRSCRPSSRPVAAWTIGARVARARSCFDTIANVPSRLSRSSGVITRRGDDDDRHVAGRLGRPQPPQDLPPVHVRHHQVEQDRHRGGPRRPAPSPSSPLAASVTSNAGAGRHCLTRYRATSSSSIDRTLIGRTVRACSVIRVSSSVRRSIGLGR